MKPVKDNMADSPLKDDSANNAVATPKVSEPTPKKVNKKKNSTKKDPNKKENFFIRIPKKIGRAFVNMWKELKNVTWPSFGKALSSTGIVLAVVAVFFVVLLAFDLGLGELFRLITGISAN